jgi:predicted PhzF superfamily epimerase YddE/YHI9
MTPFVQVDAFTSEAFAGNPAAVCFLPGEREVSWMQNVAREMNLAETAFLRPLDGEGGRREFELRWFTPTVEIDLCGHATLASAHALWESGRLAPGEQARFHTRSGLLTADPLDAGDAGAGDTSAGDAARVDAAPLDASGGDAPGNGAGGGWIQLDFPLTPNEPVPAPDGLIDAIGAGTPLYVGRSKFDYLVQVESEAVLRGVAPDLRRLSAIEARGVIVTSKAANGDYDFVSRFFAPRAGIDEDPVTGSAHCTLADFWHKQLGKTRFLARQISPRGGVLRVGLQGDRVLLGGQAITVLRGELLA